MSPAAQQTELRTFLIADIRGYTTYTREHGDEEGAELARRFGQLVEEVVAARDGFLVELRGDEALVVFVSARKALRAAVELQDRIAAEKLPRGIGIGLDAGEAIPVGDGFRGTALNLAARLCASAAAGETLASEAVIHLAAKVDGIAYVDARNLKVKGFGDAVRAVAVIPSDRTKGHRVVEDRNGRNRAPMLVVALAAVAALAVIGVAFANFLLGATGQSPSPASHPSNPAVAAASSTASIASGPSSPTESAGASVDPLAPEALPLLAFYDQATGHLEATTPIRNPRNVSFFAGGSFWILANHQFNRIDPITHQITSTANIPTEEPNGFAFDDDYIWVTDLSGPVVWRVDQESGHAVSFPLGTDESDTAVATDVTVGGDWVWLSRPDVPEVIQMNRKTGAVETRLPIEAWGMSYGADALWYWADGSIGRIDPVTKQESFERLRLSSNPNLGNIYFAGDAAWTSSADTGMIYRVDGSGRETTYALPPGVGEMAPTTDTMWVTNADTGALTGIDVVSGQVTRTIDSGHATLAASAGADQIMVAVGPTADEAIAALPGSVLTIATDGIPWSDPAPDPPINNSWQVRQTLNMTCANLLAYPDKPWPDGLTLVPEAAEALPTVSDDGLTYTFTIKPGFKFSPPSNEPVTAETFQYSLERAVSPVLGDDVSGPSTFSDIAGVAEYRAGNADHVSGLVVNGNQLSITLVAPAPSILARLATTYACPVPLGTPVLGSGLKPDIPVAGAGPYYLSQDIRKRLVVFTKNPNYGGTRPQPFDEIAIRMNVAPTTSLGLINGGGLDAVMFDGGDSLSGPQSGLDTNWGAGSANAVAGDQRWFGSPRFLVDLLLLNPTRAPFNDPDVRRAVSLALDRYALSKVWVDGPTDQLLIPAVEGSTSDAPPPQVDIQAALALMKGRTVKATMIGTPAEWDCRPCSDFQNEIKGQLQEIGIDVTIRIPPQDDPGGGAFDPGSDVDMIAMATATDWSDPVSLMSGLQSFSWLGKDNLEELATLDQASENRISGITDWARTVSIEQSIVLPYGYRAYPFFVSDRIGCGFIQPAYASVDLLGLCLKDNAASQPSPSASP